MTPSQLKPPTHATLLKYGLDYESWCAILDLQDGCCPVCGQPFTPERRPVVDHFHAKGYRNMSAEKKVRYVRGLLHSYCNYHLIPKGMTTEKAYNVYVYLSDFDLRLIGD
jgi:hypothetical protein